MDISIGMEAANDYLHSPVFYIILFLSLPGLFVFAFSKEFSHGRNILQRIQEVLFSALIILAVHLFIGIFIVAIFFYPEAQSKNIDQLSWKAESSKGITGIKSYLERYPDGIFAKEARIRIITEDLHSTIEVIQEYENTTHFAPPLEDAIARTILTMGFQNIAVTVRVKGVPLSQNYEKRGLLYTGARMEGELVVRDRTTRTIIIQERFKFERPCPKSLYLRETDPGSWKPDDAPFPWTDVVTLLEKKLAFSQYNEAQKI